MPITIALPLDVPEVRVLASRMLEDGTLLIEVESTLRTARCHRCGCEIDWFHGFDRPIRLRHLPVFGRKVVIEIGPSATAVHTVTAGRPPPSAARGTTPTVRTPRRSSRRS